MAADFIRSLGLPIPQTSFDAKAFVQGLYDAEGYVEYWKPRRTVRINFANKNWEIIKLVVETLKGVGIKKPYVRYSSRSYRIQLYRKDDVMAFAQNIGFRYPTKYNKLKIPSFLTFIPIPARRRPAYLKELAGGHHKG
ncbi:hypothetical protein CGL51_13540 [Pyrobaculum aerophilum]|uniref:DOD-type homing endonuclease domain-containing protein n=1 Tax=Pyrobaculum aerophilum TaxID=13773 RepID=A0A371QWZ1_9CREN|nr:hypothetical protein CGL51_13540 [Pyrobaculum aerophilum]RFA94947.1 hypothetical protein CGL52_13705 [Pyrobaculum aerophilum]